MTCTQRKLAVTPFSPNSVGLSMASFRGAKQWIKEGGAGGTKIESRKKRISHPPSLWRRCHIWHLSQSAPVWHIYEIPKNRKKNWVGLWNFVRAWFLGSICVQPLLWVRGHPRSVQKYGVKKTWLKNTYQAPTSNAWKMHRTYVKNNPMKMQKVYMPKMQHMQNLWKYSDWCFEYKHTSIGKGRWTLN